MTQKNILSSIVFLFVLSVFCMTSYAGEDQYSGTLSLKCDDSVFKYQRNLDDYDEPGRFLEPNSDVYLVKGQANKYELMIFNENFKVYATVKYAGDGIVEAVVENCIVEDDKCVSVGSTAKIKKGHLVLDFYANGSKYTFEYSLKKK
ncbi:MAG: hypothetical protein KDK51_08920 [Deltaproteobacteria bacterium]|nr:hypothetical protein [Deltaproteobacteria bacterium]